MANFFYRAAQRRSLRRAVTTECQVVSDRLFRLLSDQALDISKEGMLVESDALTCVGEELIVSFRLPGTRLWLDAEAEVARIVRGRRTGDRHRALGIRFTHIDSLNLAMLSGSLVGTPPPVPHRRLRRDYARTVEMIQRAAW